MIQSIKQIYGDILGASDGEVGHVKDFYFDDKHWTVRYLVADTGSWLLGRSVLISPHAVGHLPAGGQLLAVNLTRKQIENSPPIELHKPVSRQYEEEFYRYYGWPRYWQGDALWGMNGLPNSSPVMGPFPGVLTLRKGSEHKRGDAHLRSAQTISTYTVQASDEQIGHITDFLVDDHTWEIRHLVLNTGQWLPGKQVLITPEQVERISLEESKVFVNLTKESILQAPVNNERVVSNK